MRRLLVTALVGLSAARCSSIEVEGLSFACVRDDDCARDTRCHPLDHICRAPRCGDAAVDPGEACDDGNTTAGDGCAPTCALETGAVCRGQPSVCTPCGDGVRDPGEACDDGDQDDGDGCDHLCQIEPGYACGAAGCTRCGDGIRTVGESCDDGDRSGGCKFCRVQLGYTCTGELGEASTCTVHPFTSITAGFTHTCGLDDEGRVTCIGSNRYSPTDPRVTNQATPPATLPPLSAVSAGAAHTCGIVAADQQAVCWGANFVVYDSGDREVGQARVPDDLGPVLEMVAGNLNSCAVRVDGEIRCWGEGSSGQSTPPAMVPSRNVALGTYHTCAIRLVDRRAYCFGEAGPRLAAPDASYARVGVGLFHSCGVLDDGTLRCWGREGTPTPRSTPPSGNDYLDVVAGHYYSCALRRSGRAVCWGETQAAAIVRDVPDDTFHQLAGGLAHVCGLHEDGTVACWGEATAFSE